MTQERITVEMLKEINQSMECEYLFTFFFEYKGGTYIKQVWAKSQEDARLFWCNSLDFNEIKYFGKKTMEELRGKIETEELVIIDGATNVWIFNVLLKGHFSTIHIVKTSTG